jgi:putative oxidoreductase
MNGNRSGTDDLGKLVLRSVLAVLILFHGTSKIIHGIAPIMGMVAKMGLPTVLGYAVYIGEVVAPLLILFGIWARLAALAVVINMIVAILLVHTSQFFTLNEVGGWAFELQAMYLASAIAIVLLGAGRYSVGGPNGRWN